MIQLRGAFCISTDFSDFTDSLMDWLSGEIRPDWESPSVCMARSIQVSAYLRPLKSVALLPSHLCNL